MWVAFGFLPFLFVLKNAIAVEKYKLICLKFLAVFICFRKATCNRRVWNNMFVVQLNFVKANFIKTNNLLRRSKSSVPNWVLLILTKIQLFRSKYLCRTFYVSMHILRSRSGVQHLGCYLEGQGHSMTLQQNRVWPKTLLFEVWFYIYFWQTLSNSIPILGALPGSDQQLL